MNDETVCNPVPGAEVDGFNFFRDRNGSVIARCCWCLIGFDAAAENAATVRSMMIIHLELVHGLREGR
jgi:hypothetical protein